MKAGLSGTFVIEWRQTEIDGLSGNSVESINVGSTWRWHGDFVRVDDPRDILVLEGAENVAETHRRAGYLVGKILGNPNYVRHQPETPDAEEVLFENGFDLTDGYRRYQATLIEMDGAKPPMLLFCGAIPAAGAELWVVSCRMPEIREPKSQTGGVVCFVPGTKIAVPDGVKLVEDLQPGDMIQTKDNGAQELQWIGGRHISGGRLVAMPHLRPIRLRAGFLGEDEPDSDLYLSPDHRVLLKGDAAQALFNTPEVLVAARDLMNDRTVVADHNRRDVDYIHLMLGAHQILWANNVECESFHPANALIEEIEAEQRNSLMSQFPTVADDPFAYGDFARRNLTKAEAAILSFEGIRPH